MKKIITFAVALAAFLFTSHETQAQTPEQQKFLGTWELAISGMPNGTMEIPLTISFENNALKGNITKPDGEVQNFDSVEVDEDVLIAEFEADGFVINLELSMEEDGTLSGTMMNAFSVKGKKAKQQ